MLATTTSLRFVTGGASNSPIAISATDADVGDLIIIVVAHEGGAASFSGSGWTHSSYSWAGGSNYTGEFWWKVLDGRADITFTGPDLGVAYAIYRGPTSAAKVASAEGGVSGSLDLTFSTPATNCIGQLVITHEQVHAASSPGIGGFVTRVAAFSDSVFEYFAADRLFNPAAGTVTITGIDTGGVTDLYANAIELRR